MFSTISRNFQIRLTSIRGKRKKWDINEKSQGDENGKNYDIFVDRYGGTDLVLFCVLTKNSKEISVIFSSFQMLVTSHNQLFGFKQIFIVFFEILPSINSECKRLDFLQFLFFYQSLLLLYLTRSSAVSW